MNLLKKIDHYLLINHPVVWRTKVHYFVLFSFILGSVAAFGLAYFPIKCFGAIDLTIVFMTLEILVMFTILLWLITQARSKIKHYRFWDVVLTYSVYALCVSFLLNNLSLFEKTVTRTTANLVSVEQIDVDKELIESHDAGSYLYVVEEMGERYKVNSSSYSKIRSIRMSKISEKIDRIYNCQSIINIRKDSNRSSLFKWKFIYSFFPFIVFPFILFVVSHTNIMNTVVILAPTIISISIIDMDEMYIPLVYVIVLVASMAYEKNKIYRLALVPFHAMVLGIIVGLMTTFFVNSDTLTGISITVFASIIVAFHCAYLTKAYLEPRI